MATAKGAKPAPPARTGKRGQSAGLTREAILVAALAVIDERGVEGLTMRRLGEGLGVDAMAIYHHLESKAAVLDAVVERQAERLADLVPPLPTDPVDLMVAIAQHFRRVLIEHPNLAPLLASRPLPQDHVPVLVTYGASLLRAAGFDERDIPLANSAVVTFGLGFALQEAAISRRHRELGRTFEEQQRLVLAALAEVDGDTSLEREMIMARVLEAARDEQFEVGMRAMLHGLRLGLGRPAEV